MPERLYSPVLPVLPQITAIYAGLLGLGLIVLAVLVIRNRYRAKVALGGGGDAGLERAIRAHGNFCEYAPMAMLLLLLAELLGLPALLLHGAGLALVAGRVLHAAGVSRVDEVMAVRTAGMVLTFTPIAILAIAVLVRSFS